jgi:hypothetical protein
VASVGNLGLLAANSRKPGFKVGYNFAEITLARVITIQS